ncbi:hypothetical protein ASE48_22540 [Mycobacterium sp. Root265]|uniref:hypothetical protein n=1 Tax=Mycobacterium sp. Root265 TaxID=1736504 RepID=UPI0007124F4A|nr:hypothetical protein [Mycobacterium sp. Root265]KRD19804.1 hypothetical protein ASE48_22540 [Mycobacterium sp. Root265]
MAPTDNVWADGSERGLDFAFDAVENHICEHSDTATYARRALLLPHMSVQHEAYHQSYSANKNIGTARGKRPERGGPVVAVHPLLKELGLGLKLAHGQIFGVATPIMRDVTGWAAATKALDVVTGERHPGVPDDIAEALQDLHDAGYNGYARQRESFFAAKYYPPIDILMDAGYGVDFVKSYLVALGKSPDSVESIDKLYVPAPERPRATR